VNDYDTVRDGFMYTRMTGFTDIDRTPIPVVAVFIVLTLPARVIGHVHKVVTVIVELIVAGGIQGRALRGPGIYIGVKIIAVISTAGIAYVGVIIQVLRLPGA